MDLHFIASQLIAAHSASHSPPVVSAAKVEKSVETPSHSSTPTAADPNADRISLADYLKKKKELDDMLRNTCPRVEEAESDTETSSESSEESSSCESDDVTSPPEEGEMEEEFDDSAEKIDILRSKNEVSELPPVQPPPLEFVPADARLILVGVIFSLVDEQVLVQSNETNGENQALDIGSLLIFKDRKVLGEIFDTFGPVKKPIYSVRFNSADSIDVERAKRGEPIYRIEDYCNVVLPAMLMAMKGTDASNVHDEEIPEEEQDFSDDEKEQEFKACKKQSKKGGTPFGPVNPKKPRNLPLVSDHLQGASSNTQNAQPCYNAGQQIQPQLISTHPFNAPYMQTPYGCPPPMMAPGFMPPYGQFYPGNFQPQSQFAFPYFGGQFMPQQPLPDLKQQMEHVKNLLEDAQNK
jgi:rRNA processing protein Gar1